MRKTLSAKQANFPRIYLSIGRNAAGAYQAEDRLVAKLVERGIPARRARAVVLNG